MTTMEVSEGVSKDKTVTFVQVLTVADVAEAAALAVAELGQNMNNQVMQLVSMNAPVETAGSIVTIANKTSTETTASTPTPAVSAESQPVKITSSGAPDAVNSSDSAEDRICLICGDKANGVHYNVLSCEGCKSFFLRSNRSRASFTCSQGGNCNMDLYTRRHCPACRMKRCLECGMKVERVWDRDRLKTRKPLIRVKRKKRQPSEPRRSSVLSPPSPAVAPSPSPSIQSPPTPSLQAPLTPSVQQPTSLGVKATQPQSIASTSETSTPSSSRSSSPMLKGQTTVTSPSLASMSVPAQSAASLGESPAGLASSDQTFTQTLLTLSPTYPQLTEAQEQLMLTLENGYKASTEVLKHLSKDVPLFRMTHWSKLKSSGNSPCSAQEESDEEMEETEPKNLNSGSESAVAKKQSQSSTAATGGIDLTAAPGSDPLAALSAATGQSPDTIYKLTSLATGGQITDPSSALNLVATSEQGMRVIQTIGTLVQGQDLNALIGMATLVGQIIGTGGGMLNDSVAETILGGIMGSIPSIKPPATNPVAHRDSQAVQNASSESLSSSSSPTNDQNGIKGSQSSSAQDDLMSTAFAQLASSGLAEALAMLAAMASSTQNKETIVTMVKRAALALLKRKEEQQMSISSPVASASSNFYMPTDVGEEEVKMSPFLQSLQKVTSFLTSGKMSAETKSKGKPRRTVNKEMLHIAMDMFAVLVKQTIHFAKSIPGFTNLSCDDQAVLIKSSIVDALLLRCADSYALDRDCLVNDTNGDKFDVHMMYQLGFSTLPEVVFEFMRDTKACGLTTAEYALFTAAALLSPDRSDLKDRNTVEEMQLQMILTLQSATKVFHPDRPFLFTKLITKLTTLRDMSILHLSEIMAVKVQEQDLSPLIVELFGLDS